MRDEQALVVNWNPQTQRKGGIPKRARRRTVEEEIGKVEKIWKEVGAFTQTRIHWRCIVEALCS
jgi:hypothetical protein